MCCWLFHQLLGVFNSQVNSDGGFNVKAAATQQEGSTSGSCQRGFSFPHRFLVPFVPGRDVFAAMP